MTAQTACSRLEPQPKFGPTTSTVAPLYAGLLRGKSGKLGTMLVGMIRLGSAAGCVALVGEEQRTEAGSLDLLEIAGRNDQVGVDVAPVEHGQTAAVGDEGFHCLLFKISCRTSVKWPVTAAAAAMAGLTRCVRPPGP